jgi:CheY-like chemotaxis protein
MAKVLLVEDDNNLREIYEARLQAEGYDIISARDGEEALVVAKSEMPDLIISDVMMPKISGFEMLDILRATDGLKDVKVIMLTALGQAEDQTRADSLGANRYLVKSQVTLEDIVNAAKDLLGQEAAAAAAPVVAAGATIADPTAVAEPTTTPEPAPAVEPVTAPEPVAQPAPEPAAAVTPPPVIPLATAPPDEVEEPEASPQMPPTPASTVPDTTADNTTTDVAATDSDEPQTSQEESSAVERQIASFIDSQSGQPAPAVEPTPDVVQPESTDSEQPAAPTTTPEQDKALADAVDALSGSSDSAAAPEAAAEPETSSSEPAETGKKVIVPIVTEESAPQKNIQDLLKEEEAREAETQAPVSPTPAPTEPAPAPEAAPQATPAEEPTPQQPAPTKPNGDFDPHSIAL